MSDSWWGCYAFLETEQRGSVGPNLLAFFPESPFLVMKDEVKQDSFISEWFTSHLSLSLSMSGKKNLHEGNIL